MVVRGLGRAFLFLCIVPSLFYPRDDSAMMEAYFDAKCGGEDGDWADVAFEASLYEF